MKSAVCLRRRRRAALCAFVLYPAIALPDPAPDFLVEGPKEIPVIQDVDVVVAGGSSGAVQAACSAAQAGAKVFLVTPFPYLGTDLCATLQLWLEPGEQPQSALALACFGAERQTTPLRVKSALDQALLDAGVSCLTGCFVTDVLKDSAGRLAGIVIANRSGRQAVRAKLIVDATCQAALARQAGAPFRPSAPGPHTFTRAVLGGPLPSGPSFTASSKGLAGEPRPGKPEHFLPLHLCRMDIPMPDHSVTSYFQAEQLARDWTQLPEIALGAELLSCLPPDTILSGQRLDAWPGALQCPFVPFQPRAIPRLYVLSAYADLSPEAAAPFLRPLELMAVAARIGQAAAGEARALPRLTGALRPGAHSAAGPSATIGESLAGLRGSPLGTIQAGPCQLPVLGRYDVVVAGGGTSGAPAAIAAARAGAKTLVIESLHELGGVGTVGLIAAYWYGERRGFTASMDQQVNPGTTSWNAVAKAEWLRRELRRAGADIWFGTLACGAIAGQGRVRGVVVATPRGRGAVLAATVVDATGNSDVAASAQASTQYSIQDGSLNVQIAGFPERPLGKSYVNTCYTMVDDTDVLDVSHLMLWKRTAASRPHIFDMGQLVDSRERRRVLGDYTLTVPDILAGRRFPDTISHHYSNFDAAAFPDSPVLLVSDAKGPCFHTDMPYRCLLPKDLDGILVTGLGASAERDAMTLIRMQADLQNQGYAAGLAAAAAAQTGGRTREIDLKALQRQLIREEILEERVAADLDSFPLPREELEQAIALLDHADAPTHLRALAVVMTHASPALPLLQARYRETPDPRSKLLLARILAMLGDPSGVSLLVEAIEAQPGWDPGSALSSQRKTGNTFSSLDRLIIALGSARAPQGQPALLRKLSQLQPESEISHYKALSLALWNNPAPAAASHLAALLARPGFAGHATMNPVLPSQTAEDGKHLPARAAPRLVTGDDDVSANRGSLNAAMKELLVAALLVRCGDQDGRGAAILRAYAQDIHGHFSRYARSLLASPSPSPAEFRAAPSPP